MTRTKGRPGRRRSAGLTLVELMIAIAVLGILATLAVPSLAERLARQRLASAAETLAMDLAEARVEAAASGQALHVVFDRGADWCWAVARSASCGCTAPASCQLKVSRAADWPGVDLLAADATAFEPGGVPEAGTRAQFRGRGSGHLLEVGLSPLGRSRLCTGSGMPGYVAC
mgnify:CR=1 FL=1